MPYVPGQQEGLPLAAKQRLLDMRGSGAQPKLFTSDLSSSEFALVDKAGFEPLGFVMGSSIYHVGFQYAGLKVSQELTVLTQAMYEARELAMTRMEEEADLLGADGVVGVRLEVNRYAWGPDLAEFKAIGTAIRHRGGGNFRTVDDKPFTSDLSGQDFYVLLQTGYRPLALVMGNCVYHVAIQGLMQAMRQMGRNIEMANYTQALYDARELALSRIQAEAEREKASGIVGAQVVESSYGWDSHVIEFFAVGTAVTQTEKPTQVEPQLSLPLSS